MLRVGLWNKREMSEEDATIEDLNANIASLRAQLRPAIERFERAEDENAVLRRKLEEVKRPPPLLSPSSSPRAKDIGADLSGMDVVTSVALDRLE